MFVGWKGGNEESSYSVAQIHTSEGELDEDIHTHRRTSAFANQIQS